MARCCIISFVNETLLRVLAGLLPRGKPARCLVFEHLKEDYDLNLQVEIKLRLLILIFEDARKQLKTFSLNFSVANHFHPYHLQPKTLVNSFRALI